MPVYEYECNKCREKFSQLRRFWDKDDEVKCPKCGSVRVVIRCPRGPD